MTRKSFAVLLCIVCVLMTLGCANVHVKYSAGSSYVTDVALDGVMSTAIIEEKLWNEWTEFTNPKAGDSSVVYFRGQRYTGTYDYSMEREGMPFSEDYYKTESGKKFSTKSNTGEFTSYTLTSLDYKKNVEPFLPDLDNPKEAARSIALKIARKYIDIDNYEITLFNEDERSTEKDGVEYKTTLYYYYLTKKIGNLDTADQVYICISSKGTLYCLRLGDTGAFDKIKEDSIDLEAINDSVIEKVKSIFANSYYEHVSQTFRSQQLCYTPDQKLAVITDVEVIIKDQNNMEFGTIVEITTILTPNEVT